MQWSNKTTLNFVAHEDDDLLFLSPDLLHTIQADHTVRTVFLTAGDSGTGADYWQNRESGIRAAYAQMRGVTNSWVQTDAGITGHPIPIFTLSEHPSLSLAFMRLPDGNIDGSGFLSTNHQSLQYLWTGLIPTIDTIDGSSSYSKTTLIHTLTTLMLSFQPNYINTQDYINPYGDGDHSDHHSVAYLVWAATQQYTTPHRLTGYENYTTSSRLANVTGTDLTAKQDAFYTYAHYDKVIEGVPEIFPERWRTSLKMHQIVFLSHSLRLHAHCLLQSVMLHLTRKNTTPCTNRNYLAWLPRQYTVDLRFNGGNRLPITNRSGLN
jgi:LmbE family N-acetylglucosaminyl deacetylase